MADTETKAAAAADAEGKSPTVRWDDTNMATSYANVANVSSTREEVTVFFGTNQTWNASDKEFKILLSNRMILSPFAAKRLSLLLAGVLNQYESRYGEIKLEGAGGAGGGAQNA